MSTDELHWRRLTRDDCPPHGKPFLCFGYSCMAQPDPIYFVGFLEAPLDLFGQPQPMRIRVRGVSVPLGDYPGLLWQGSEEQCKEHTTIPLDCVIGWMPLPAAPKKQRK